jgi:GNAT superfamily N-acetyltransferase
MSSILAKPNPALALERTHQVRTRAPVVVRRATSADVEALAALNREAYPDLVEDGVVFSAAQLAEQQTRFPEGQIVAQMPDGALAGAIATLILPGTRALEPHTWYEATADGTFATHDRSGDSLYLADIFVGRAFWGQGVGPVLYDALKALCVETGCARIVAGGRLWSYFGYEGKLTPEQYVLNVTDGRIQDRVLTGQLRAGFKVRGILAKYLSDPRSASYATLLEWVPPRLV